MIPSDLTETQRQIRDTARAFAEREIAPYAAEWDRAKSTPRALYEKMAKVGLMGVCVDPKYGGAGADFFDFNSIKDSVTGNKRDKILDFDRSEADKIDLAGIDAKMGKSGNQKFKWIGKQDFHDKKGELRYEKKGAKAIVQGDVNGDGKADFEINVSAANLNAVDFIL